MGGGCTGFWIILFNNAFKYAMIGSRVYVDLYEDEDSACFIMKNISQEPFKYYR